MNKDFQTGKEQLEKLKEMLKAENARHKAAVEDIEQQAEVVIKEYGDEAKKMWEDILKDFEDIGKKINWVKWRYVYIGVGLILFGLVMHYVFGF